MRFSFLVAILPLAAATLSGCGNTATDEKPGKTAALSGRQEVVLRLAHATEAAGDYPGAEKLYLQVAAQNPDAPDTHLELAEFYKRHHEDQKAIDGLKTAIKLQPTNTDIARELANTYINAGEPDKALVVLDTAIAGNGHNALLYNSRGVALDQIGNYREAQKSYKTAFDLDPSGSTMYKINLSMSYILEGSYDKATALLRPMLDGPDAPPIARQNLALAYGLKGESENALKLGLQDLSTSEAEENVRFYRMLAHKHHAYSSDAEKPVAEVPPSVVKELFPDEEPIGPAKVLTVEIPQPEMKPQAMTPAPVASVTAQEETAPAPLPEKKANIVAATPITIPAAPADGAVPAQSQAKAEQRSQPVKPEEEEEDDDDEAMTPSPASLHDEAPSAAAEPQNAGKSPMPTIEELSAEEPSSGGNAMPNATTVIVAPDEMPLPEPVLKPDAR